MEACKILVTNQKGGVGKSTISANLAAYLQIQHAQSVCLIDYDRQSSSSQWVKRAPNIGINVQNLSMSYEGNGRLLLTEAKMALRKYSQNVEISISDLTWTHSIPMEFLLEFDLILVPSGTSKFEMASSEIFVLEYLQKYQTQITQQRQPIIMVPSRVHHDFDINQAFLHCRNIDTCFISPALLFNQKLDQFTYEDFLCVSPDDQIANNFSQFGGAIVDQIIQWREYRASMPATGSLAYMNNRKVSVLDNYRLQKQQEKSRPESFGRFIPAFLRRKD